MRAEVQKTRTIVIPARYDSSRLAGKCIIDICGKPMIWWVYEQCLKVKNADAVYVAIDDERTEEVCKKYGIRYIMTSKNCPSHILRIWEVSNIIESDLYVEVCGDEPLIEPDAIDSICSMDFNADDYCFMQAYTDLTNPIDAYDFTVNKFVTDMDDNVLYFTRSPIPYPKGSREFHMKKGIGIHAFTKKSLDFIKEHDKIGELEKIEEIDELRFLEYGHKVKAVKVDSKSKSVDTKKDLEYVRNQINLLKKNDSILNNHQDVNLQTGRTEIH